MPLEGAMMMTYLEAFLATILQVFWKQLDWVTWHWAILQGTESTILAC